MNIETFALCAAALAGCAVNLAGCASAAATPGSTPSSGASPVRRGKPVTGGPEALAAVDQNMQRLRALEVFEVGTLIVPKPKDEGCYVGEPCPGRDDAWARARELAAVRLATFAKDAEASAAQTKLAGDGSEAEKHVDENLAALTALNIVGIKGLVKVTPVNNPSCYNHPCQQDIAAANATNALHAAKLEAIVRATAKPTK